MQAFGRLTAQAFLETTLEGFCFVYLAFPPIQKAGQLQF